MGAVRSTSAGARQRAHGTVTAPYILPCTMTFSSTLCTSTSAPAREAPSSTSTSASAWPNQDFSKGRLRCSPSGGISWILMIILDMDTHCYRPTRLGTLLGRSEKSSPPKLGLQNGPTPRSNELPALGAIMPPWWHSFASPLESATMTPWWCGCAQRVLFRGGRAGDEAAAEEQQAAEVFVVEFDLRADEVVAAAARAHLRARVEHIVDAADEVQALEELERGDDLQ